MARVNEVRFVGYAVPDLDSERQFYIDTWGLAEVPSADDMVYLSAAGAPQQYVVRLRRGKIRHIDIISWIAADRDEVDALFRQVSDAGGKVFQEPSQLAGPDGGYGFRFFDPDGHAIEICSDAASGRARVVERGEAIPVRISHIVMHSPDHKALVEWYCKALGFRISDWLGEYMAFLRCNSWHHRLAILPGPASLNHVAYDVSTIDDLMRGISRLRKDGIEPKWGPGRHTAGNNTFSYYTTPNENVVEYTSDLDRVDDDNHRPNIYTPSPDLMDQWGVGVGGPHSMVKPQEDPALWRVPPA